MRGTRSAVNHHPMKNIILALFISVVLLAACEEHECINSNEAFNTYPHDSPEYKSALLPYLNERDGLAFILKGYEEKDGIPHLLVEVQGDSLCALADVAITQPDGTVAGIIKNKGAGYIYAELSGLKIGLLKDPMGTHFVYRGMDYIID
jgi:hypothetical protein